MIDVNIIGKVSIKSKDGEFLTLTQNEIRAIAEPLQIKDICELINLMRDNSRAEILKLANVSEFDIHKLNNNDKI